MQAVILAAGMGKRLGELTKNNTKCMIKVNGITLIERVLTQLSSLPLTRIIIVIGYKGEELRAFLGNTYNGLAIEYIENKIYDKTNNIYSLSLISGGYVVAGWAAGGLSYTYYPACQAAGGPGSLSLLTVYLALCLTPLALEAWEERQWKRTTKNTGR